MNEDIDRIADEIAEVAAHLDAATHRLLALIRAFDEREGWARAGALSCAHWLSWRIGLDLVAARERVRVARALGSLARVDEALRRGEVSYSKVRAMVRVATPENEATLLELARSSTGAQLERLCRRYRGVTALARADEDGRCEDMRSVERYEDEDGTVVVRAKLRPEEAALLWKALDAARHALRPTEASRDRAKNPAGDDSAESSRGSTGPAPSRADALMAVVESFLAAGAPGKAIGPQCEVVIHVDPAALTKTGADPDKPAGVLEDGTPVPAETARRFSCDCALVRVADGRGGEPLDVGRRTRSIPAALRRALVFRDRGCRFPGCTHSVFVDGHHVEHWADGGETALRNLVLLCRRHHRLVHEGGFELRRLGDGDLAFFDPRGRRLEEAPRATLVEGDGAVRLAVRNRMAGLSIDARTGLPRWDGERMAQDFAVDALLHPARAPCGRAIVLDTL